MVDRFIAKCIPGILGGAVVGFLAAATKASMNVEDNFTEKLMFQPEAFDIDLHCAQLFLQLQSFRSVSEKEFDEAGSDADSLFCLEKSLALELITYNSSHGIDAVRYYRQMMLNLSRFFDKARDYLYEKRKIKLDQAEMQGVNETVRQQLSREMEQGKENVRGIYHLIIDIQNAVKRHVRQIAALNPHGIYTMSRPAGKMARCNADARDSSDYSDLSNPSNPSHPSDPSDTSGEKRTSDVQE